MNRESRPRKGSHGRISAVDLDVLSGDIGRFVAGEENGGGIQLALLSVSAERNRYVHKIGERLRP